MACEDRACLCLERAQSRKSPEDEADTEQDGRDRSPKEIATEALQWLEGLLFRVVDGDLAQLGEQFAQTLAVSAEQFS